MSDAQQNNQPAILIPGFDGGEACLSVTLELLKRGFPVIAACEPGDSSSADAARIMNCVVIQAEKDNALRAGLEYFHKEMQGLPGVVFLDMGDGYTLNDILAVAYVFAVNPTKVVLAQRARSKDLKGSAAFECRAAHLAFTFVHGRPVKDPWVGLVGLPTQHFNDFLKEKGNSRNLTFSLLLKLQRLGLRVINVPVGTSYGREQGAVSKRRVFDIARIVLLGIKFISSSLMAFLSDYCLRFLFFYVILHGNEPVSLAIGRYTGALVGYLMNRNVVFKQNNDTWRKELNTIVKYAILATINYYISHLLIGLLMKTPSIGFALASIMADSLLYVPNYLIQRDVVFRRKTFVGNN